MRICTIGAIFTLLSASATFANETPPHTIAVMGEAEMRVQPDFATVTVGVVTQGESVSGTLAGNNAKMNRVLDALKSLDLPETDIRTTTFSVEPKYEKSDSNVYDPEALRPVIGYAVSNRVVVSVADTSKIAKIIDTSVEAGAAGEVKFSVKNPTEEFDRARRAAVDAAFHKAQILSSAAHMTLGPPISITDNEANNYYNGETLDETVVVTGSRTPTTPIEAGGIPIKVQVTVLYDAK